MVAPCYPTCVIPNCPQQCEYDLQQIFNPNNCSNYYVCVAENLLGPMECTVSAPYFDGIRQGCSDNENVCCNDLCVAYCHTKGAEIPHPYDCTKYYLCLRIGLATDEDLLSCSSGSNFDVSTGRCVAGAPCNILCPDDPDVHEGSTTPAPICQDSMMCTVVGLFPKCTLCDPQFFNCRTVGQPATIETCTGSKVFNTDPAYPYCVIPSDCLHHPPYKVHQPLH
ncbi:uncharacterized protein [Procambarus clarkii]|uniref:uncharacterized protein n=1 Tax=Procambarus clarkii TaxID=6728 RepID=UPI003743EB75